MAENLPTRPRQGADGTGTAEPPSPAPPHLSAEASAMWDAIVTEWLLGADALPLLRGALESWDLFQAARARVAKEGPTVTTSSGMIRTHPAAKLALDAFAAFRQAMRQLGLEPPTAKGEWHVA